MIVARGISEILSSGVVGLIIFYTATYTNQQTVLRTQDETNIFKYTLIMNFVPQIVNRSCELVGLESGRAG